MIQKLYEPAVVSVSLLEPPRSISSQNTKTES